MADAKQVAQKPWRLRLRPDGWRPGIALHLGIGFVGVAALAASIGARAVR